jgi:hypothetical protein
VVEEHVEEQPPSYRKEHRTWAASTRIAQDTRTAMNSDRRVVAAALFLAAHTGSGFQATPFAAVSPTRGEVRRTVQARDP